MTQEMKTRVIQEYVPGKQVTLAHVIANADEDLYKKIGLNVTNKNAIGILTITPSEGAIVAADIATKSGNVEIGFIDRFSGSLVITGDVSSVEASLAQIVTSLELILGFSPTKITRT